MNALPPIRGTTDHPPPGLEGASDAPPARPIRTFVRRAGRTTEAQARALQTLGPTFVIPYTGRLDTLAGRFPQLAETAGAGGPAARPLVLEIGFGMGEATAQIAQGRPGTDFLGCEVHEPGVGALLKRVAELGLRNVHILAHDATEVVDHMLPVWSPQQPARGLDGIHLFFPDPWHKNRHHKRRLVQPARVARLVERLKPGGYLHCATDWQPYAQQMLEVLGAEPRLENRHLRSHPELGGFAPRPDYRPPTKFERRGLRLGHGVWDLVLHRI